MIDMIKKGSLSGISSDNNDEIDRLLGSYEDTPLEVHQDEIKHEEKESDTGISFKEGENATLSGEVFTGIMFLTVVESFMPIIIGILNDKFDKKKIDIKKLKLSASQKKELAPIADKVMAQIDITANPVLLLSVSLVGIYGMNYMALRNQID